tara:strand:- start:468 stop:1151 length:684 start_codon:yes stop_codon:yes gene_type:complete
MSNSFPDGSLIRSVLLVFLSSLLSACVTSTVQEIRETTTSVTTDDTVVVLGKKDRPSSQETELDFVGCVSDNLSAGKTGIEAISEQRFVDEMFPWFEPRTAPIRTTNLNKLISDPLISNKFKEIGLKYLIWIEGNTERTDSAGTLTCGVAPGAAGCFGFLTWENDSAYEATIWDIETGKTAGRVSSEATGTSFMPALVVPIPIIARVKNNACTSLAKQIGAFIQNSG